jgi:hypothetical protein
MPAAPVRSFAMAVRAPGAPEQCAIRQGPDAVAPTKEAADSAILNRSRAARRFCETKIRGVPVLSPCPGFRVPSGGGNSDTRTNAEGEWRQDIEPGAPSAPSVGWQLPTVSILLPTRCTYLEPSRTGRNHADSDGLYQLSQRHALTAQYLMSDSVSTGWPIILLTRRNSRVRQEKRHSIRFYRSSRRHAQPVWQQLLMSRFAILIIGPARRKPHRRNELRPKSVVSRMRAKLRALSLSLGGSDQSCQILIVPCRGMPGARCPRYRAPTWASSDRSE